MDPRNLRIGQGYDVHQLVGGRKLIMGGVDIPHTRGLLGHSDADVLAHAVADALLGGVRGGDIGKLFPDTDPAYEGADSPYRDQMRENLARAMGVSPENVGVKATTTEHLGFEGREEGISATAVALLVRCTD